MTVYQIEFSPTGGTSKAASFFTEPFCEEVSKLDLLDSDFQPENTYFAADDLCIVAVPSFGGRVPEIAASKLACLNGNGARAILIAVYGNREFDDTLLELKDILSETGFICIAGVAAIAEHSIARSFAAGRPEAEDARQLQEFAREIIRKLQSSQASQEAALPGNRPYKEYNGSSAKPATNQNCTGCGLCSAECPVQAIPAENPKATLTETCISCMRCISICPSHARELPHETIAAITKRLEPVCSERKENSLFL